MAQPKVLYKQVAHVADSSTLTECTSSPPINLDAFYKCALQFHCFISYKTAH